MSAAAVARSACQALRRRPLFPRAVMAMERQQQQQLPRFSQRAETFSVRRLHTSDSAAAVAGKKPAETNAPTTSTVEDSAAAHDKLDSIIDSYDQLILVFKELAEQKHEEVLRRRGRRVLLVTVVAGVLAAKYVKMRFFGGDKEDDKQT